MSNHSTVISISPIHILVNSKYKLSFSGAASIEVCHCEERSDVAISWYNLSYCSAFFNVVPGDCHVGLTTSSQ